MDKQQLQYELTKKCNVSFLEIETFYHTEKLLKHQSKQLKIALGNPWNWSDSLDPSLPD